MKYVRSILIQWMFVALTLASVSKIEAAKLHALMVADIHDSSIGLSVRQDIFQWMWEFNRIGEFTDLEVETHMIIDDQFSAEKIIGRIQDLEVEPDDVVIFAYSGHGYRNESKPSKWPVLFINWSKKCLDVTTVMEEIGLKGARFSLIVADCCNAIYPDHEAPSYRDIMVQSRGDYSGVNYRRLFLESTGMLVISASDVGEYAYGYSYGGLYTYNLLSNLRKYTKTLSGITWDSLLAKTSDRVIHKQTPIHEFLEWTN